MNVEERYELALDRVKEIEKEHFGEACFDDYFKKSAALIVVMCNEYEFLRKEGQAHAAIDELEERNKALFAETLPGQYQKSYANPSYAVAKLGDFGQLLSYLYTEILNMRAFAYDQNLEELVIRMEIFLEVYGAFCISYEEIGKLPVYQEIKEILYWFISDYYEVSAKKRVKDQLDWNLDRYRSIILKSDLKDLRYLYAYGEYVTEDEKKMAEYMNSLPEETISLMADTYTEGYRIGFRTTGKDISGRRSVSVYYHLGLERIMKRAIENFEKIGLKTVVFRPAVSIVQCGSPAGFTSTEPNKQFLYDHKEDGALFYDKQLIHRKLEAIKAAYEVNKEVALVYGGPAVVEVFGEEPFAPVSNPNACKFSKEQQKLMVEFRQEASNIVLQYIKEETRSFTIIAFPMPAIGENFEEIFHEIIKINTLDYKLYQGIQQSIIDVLDTGEYVTVKGMNGNRTDLKVMLQTPKNTEKETCFENCVADVNIPVGEVFTSPKLTGTEGTLHVSRVFLHELEYKDLELQLTDGMITSYGCSNFAEESENLKYIKDNILNHQDTLPIGEFAIGTNTTAYVAAKKYHMEALLPILIAEKMGPHFAMGDTCYSHAEDIPMMNPDGKEMIARDNECSIKRKDNSGQAYYNCHTDITIPYDELGELAVVTVSGEKRIIISEGRFVLPGCEALNTPFKEK